MFTKMIRMNHIISHKRLSIDTVKNIISSGAKLELSQEAEAAIVKCRKFLDTKMEDIGRPVYGVTTGFGSLCNITIPAEDLSQLQHNLVMSHACGTGEKVRPEIVKLMLLLKVQSLSYGYSGVQLITVQRLIDMFNNDVLPVVYQQGSLGASGDLAPLAHLCLPLIGLVMEDSEVTLAAACSLPLLRFNKRSAAVKAYAKIAKRIQGIPEPITFR